VTACTADGIDHTGSRAQRNGAARSSYQDWQALSGMQVVAGDRMTPAKHCARGTRLVAASVLLLSGCAGSAVSADSNNKVVPVQRVIAASAVNTDASSFILEPTIEPREVWARFSSTYLAGSDLISDEGVARVFGISRRDARPAAKPRELVWDTSGSPRRSYFKYEKLRCGVQIGELSTPMCANGGLIAVLSLVVGTIASESCFKVSEVQGQMERPGWLAPPYLKSGELPEAEDHHLVADSYGRRGMEADISPSVLVGNGCVSYLSIRQKAG
jgi:hypothetical protein